ncbi:Mrp/NBP35 family ATP-binding protein [Deinococcus radiodurans]|jgi:ATPases involved in chromosome partitioning|uniref:Iron-sulfur cluster carrier protein n=1 Tax=Deinococcus radiodurans (strain ATCC 13939 / DSM 20539 / JCM 16871 / CCUG 27074 / LMG 4051 / NBRC 15346 / NCIMB 9279 / VKM B-1422 / R1) TaxID=243230 RepID=APBC_DEIRA|nr:Mrp/NBP35 family ATP-binding protein [Deinococcus radiodurans]Q9RVM9.1 RecName: Full=Iron-sulfur cluster carrier protein [Deinococcus radiodurans R1 = ATCC 13939 = DSM 20539]AAF10574.1 mrp protein [Deinococcus radiodurans R1 = ATCC 13939 = DSM 20539]ANC71811.1 chromosome partitioning protein [Deinococcus radiodurans R1 = ATCC 13939 = DSM 20539]QEM70492.1 MRP family ATP-binding protein [Deinococcus radiodurans]QIP29100.1 Mrp/NBP35 family ATP-binding protein [Deinococcus radiodurans]QIP32199
MNDALLRALSTVNDPELHRDLVSLGMIERAELSGDVAQVKVNLTTPACPLKGQIELDVRSALLQVPGVRDVQIEFGAMVRAATQPALPGVKHVVLVGSGKGGVGKSSVAVNLAASLARDGARVGLLDADVYGPSVAHMLGQGQARVTANEDRKMRPIEAHGVRFISMANLSPAGQALVWRGPMLHSAIQQFLKDSAWGELDYLIVDLPPGTGDVQLSLTQTVQVTGAVIVTTPQDVALIDAARAIDMFRKASVPVLGVVENMSYFVAPDTGLTYDIFGRGGSRKLGEQYPLLGEIPLDVEVRKDADAGAPAILAHPESVAAQALRAVARTLAGQISVRTLSELPEQLPVL